MELRVLRYFLAVAREGSITAAAETLHVTQPTLSRQLSQLERELGVTLFERTPHGIALTGEGRLLSERASELIELADKTESEVRTHSEELSGTVYLGAGELRAERVLYRLVRAFRELHPRVEFDVYAATSDIIKERMDKALIDVGLLVEPIELERYDFLRLGTTESWVVTVRSDDPLAQGGAIRAEELLARPLILPRRLSMQGQVAHWFGGLFDDLKVAGHTNLSGNATAMVREGVGVALTSSDLNLDDVGEGIKVVPLDPPLRTDTILAWRHELALSETARAFVAFAKKEAPGMLPGA